VLTFLLVAQSLALVVLIGRLLPGRNRRPPVLPIEDHGPPRVSVLLPTLNEAKRLQPCLEGLMKQGPSLREVLVIDGNSGDGTVERVADASARDPRVRVVQEPALPNGWIGKVWALQHGLEQSSSAWVLNVDADIEPVPGLVAAALEAAEELDVPVVSFSPLFSSQTPAEQWLQAALLITLVYRNGAVGARATAPAHRVMANGQCFLARRDVLTDHGGFAPARASFSDDVTLARHLARRGVRVGFLDGSRLFRVRAYCSLGQMWREWGRSIDLKDATTRWQQLVDIAFLGLVQGAPIPVLVSLLLGVDRWSAQLIVLFGVNAVLLGIRVAMLLGIASAYEVRRWTYFFSPLADPIAILRVLLSTLTRPRQWRGRSYAAVMNR